jgi:hypothetical protein
LNTFPRIVALITARANTGVLANVSHMPRCQFHKHFTRAFFANIFVPKIYKAETFGFVIFWRQNIGKKCPSKMLIKLNKGRFLCISSCILTFKHYIFLNFYMWRIKFTNETCKKIIVLIFLTMKAMILDTHGI